MMFRDNGQVFCIFSGEIFKIMIVVHRTIMYLSGVCHLGLTVVMIREFAFEDIHHLSVKLMGVESTAGSRLENTLHYFYLFVGKVARVEFALSALEAVNPHFSYIFEINNHVLCAV